jgi:branched-chain amino acid transport system substrate-binding protein
MGGTMLNRLLILWILTFAFGVHAAPRVVEIGIASNFSEISSSSSNPYGNYFRQGIQLALEHNKSVLKKKNIEVKLTEFDYGTSQMKVVEVAEKACQSNVSLVLGYVYSSDALLAAPIHQKCKLPLFSPSATANRLGEFGSYVHLGAFNNKFQGKVLAAQIAKEKLKAKKALVIFAEDCAYCTDLASAFEIDFKIKNGVVDKISILSTETDFTALAEKVRTYQADVVLVPNHELLSLE